MTTQAPLPALEWASWPTPFVFFTGKGGVGKTTVAAAVAVRWATPGGGAGGQHGPGIEPRRRVRHGRCGVATVPGVPGLEVMNLDPDAAAAAYRERVIGALPRRRLRRGAARHRGAAGGGVHRRGRGVRPVHAADRPPRADGPIRPRAVRHRPDRPHAAVDEPAERLVAVHRAEPRRGELPGTAVRAGGAARAVSAPRSSSSATPSARRWCSSAAPTPRRCARPPEPASELAAQGIRNQRLVINGLFDEPLRGDVVAEALAERQREALDVHARARCGRARRSQPFRWSPWT